MDKGISIYIHVPFCKSKCYYCDFVSYDNRDHCIKEYMKCLKKEVRSFKGKLYGISINTIFIGGGTPSYVEASYIYDVMQEIYSCCNVDDAAEITIEANPGTLDKEKLMIYKSANINRLSLGLQSTNDFLLQKLGRIHTYQEFIHNFGLARHVGFSNISVDVMFGIPRQSCDMWKHTLDDVVQISPEHVSAYSLSIEDGTRFGDMYRQGKLSYVDDEQDRWMYHHAIEFLDKHGYGQYEISNFAKTGCCSRHNKVYWQDECYIGLGLGAHSYFNGTRYNNVYDMQKYISLIKKGESVIENVEIISKERDMSDYMILGLRLIEGVNRVKFKEKFDIDLDLVYKERIEKLCSDGLIACHQNNIALTKKGLDLANRVFVEFV